VQRKDSYWDGTFLGDTVSWRQVPGDPLRLTRTLVTVLDLDKYEVGQGVPADRFFVRAFARTGGVLNGVGVDAFAFTNPIWIRRNALAPSVVAPVGGGVKGIFNLTPEADEAPTLSAAVNAQGQMVITFTGICTFSPRLGEPFQDLPEAVSPYVVPVDKQTGFF